MTEQGAWAWVGVEGQVILGAQLDACHCNLGGQRVPSRMSLPSG